MIPANNVLFPNVSIDFSPKVVSPSSSSYQIATSLAELIADYWLKFCFQKKVCLLFHWLDAFRQSATVVLGHTVFPLEEVRNRLRLNTDLHPPQAGQQKVHLIVEPHSRPKVL